MKARISARTHKETQRRKNALESSSLPAKLADCRTSDVEQSELFIVEGDSALGTAKLARNSEYQALLPIRGKILNVQKASISDMLSNAECAAIIQTIGAGSGRFDLDAARYGKIILMSDADVDGAHIRTLLLTLFFRYMRPLIEAGRVYAAVPPLHRVIVVNPGSKPNETIYTYSEQELHTLLAKVQKSGRRWQEPVQRYKGLGEMDADQLAETTMDRAGRLLRRVRVQDAEAVSECSSCSWAAMWHRDATSSSPPATDSTVRPSTPDRRRHPGPLSEPEKTRGPRPIWGIRSRAIAAATGTSG
jgi:DNA gyrase subunit B